MLPLTAVKQLTHLVFVACIDTSTRTRTDIKKQQVEFQSSFLWVECLLATVVSCQQFTDVTVSLTSRSATV